MSILVNAPTTPKMRVEETLALPTLSPRRGGSTQRVPEIFTPVVVALLHGDLCPSLSTRYSTASPVNGALNDLDDDPAAIEFCDIVCPLAGLNHSTANVRELAMAERSIVNAPPEGA